MKASLAITVASLLAIGFPAHADTIFSQDFENGLGSNEFVFGSWGINDAHPELNNDTMMMGHSELYGIGGPDVVATPSENFYAYYEVTLDLRGFEDVVLTFDFIAGIEQDFDGFNILGSTTHEFAPPAGLLNPTAVSGLQYRPLTFHGASSVELGPTAWSSPVDGMIYDLDAIYDLSAFADQKVTLRFQFGSDELWGGEGANFDNILVEGTPLPDSDNDGMPDSFEDAIDGLDSTADDSGDDLDGDGLTNLEEFERCTNPDDTDTDDDGFTDDIESNSGNYVSPEDPGTNPVRADSDRDGLDDGVETNTGIYVSASNTGTDPNNPDTDGDGFVDGADPDPTNASIYPTVIFGGSPFTTTHVYNAGTMNLDAARRVTADGNEEGERIIAETPFIHFHDNTGPPAFFAASRPYPLWDDENGGAGGFGTRDDFAIRSVGEIKIRPPGGLVTFVCNSDDGFSLTIDGTEVGTVGDRGRGDTLMEVNLAAGRHELEFIHWERGGGAGVTVAVHRDFGGGAPPFTARNESQWELLSASGSGLRFRMTDIVYDQMIDEFTLTWTADEGGTYGLFYSEDAIEWGFDLNDSILAADPSNDPLAHFEEGSLTYGPFTNPLPSAKVILFRAQED